MIPNASRTSESTAVQLAIGRRQADTRAKTGSTPSAAGNELKSFEAMMARHLKSARQMAAGPEDLSERSKGNQESDAEGEKAAQSSDGVALKVPGRDPDALTMNPALSQLNTGKKPEGGGEGGSHEIKGVAGHGKPSAASSAKRPGQNGTTTRSAEDDKPGLRPGRGTLAGARGDREVAGKDPLAKLAEGEAGKQVAPETAEQAVKAGKPDGLQAEGHRATPDLLTTTAWSGLGASQGLETGSAAAPEPAVQVQVPTPLQDPEFPQTFASQVSILTQQGVTHAELSINPPNMGPVQIEIRHQGNKVEVDFKAEFKDTRLAIESSMGQLRDLLGEQGIELQDSWVRSMTVAPTRESQDSQAANGQFAADAGRQGEFARQQQAGTHGQNDGRGAGTSRGSGQGSGSGREDAQLESLGARGPDGRITGARPMAGISLFA